jgi:hypothetical protein
VFEAYKDNAPIVGTRGNEDTATGQKCTTDATGKCTISDLLAGEYWIVETTTPAGHDTAADKHVTVTTSTTPVSLTFIDPRQQGAIAIQKTAKHADTSGATSPNLVAGFTIKNSAGAVVSTVNTNASGKACVDSLQFGDYKVSETTVPNGYKGDTSVKSVTVDNKASCDGNSGTTSTAGEGPVSFENTPLTDITVSATSQVPGGTASKITCDQAPTPADGTANAFDDTSETVKDLAPGTYTCTVVVDP